MLHAQRQNVVVGSEVVFVRESKIAVAIRRSYAVEQPRHPVIRRVVLREMHIAQRCRRLCLEPNGNGGCDPEAPYLRGVAAGHSALLRHHVHAECRASHMLVERTVQVSGQPARQVGSKLRLDIDQLLRAGNFALLVHHPARRAAWKRIETESSR